MAPALAGSGALLKFRTAADLQAFIRAAMPYQDPGVLQDEEYWAITAYVLDYRGIDLPPGGLSAETAQDLVIIEGQSPSPKPGLY